MHQPSHPRPTIAVPTFEELANTSSTDAVLSLLQAAGLDVAGTDTYKVLGLDRIIGPAFSRNDLEARGNTANIILDLGVLKKWSEGQKATMTSWRSIFENAVAQCRLDYGDMTAARKVLRSEPKSLARFREPGPEGTLQPSSYESCSSRCIVGIAHVELAAG